MTPIYARMNKLSNKYMKLQAQFLPGQALVGLQPHIHRRMSFATHKSIWREEQIKTISLAIINSK